MKEAERIGNFVSKYSYLLPNYPWYYYLITLIILIILYKYLNKKFIEKNGYPIIYWFEIGLIFGNGAFLFAGTTWREYAIENSKKILYPNILIAYSWFAIICTTLAFAHKYYKTKRKLGWLNIMLALFLTYILYAFTGIIIGIIIAFVILSAIAGVNWNTSGGRYNSQDEHLKERWIADNTPGPNIGNDKYY